MSSSFISPACLRTAAARRSAQANQSHPQHSLIFVDGEPEKVAKVKAKVPDGNFIPAAELKDTLKKFAK
jgi:hypothetical protein